MPYEFWVLPVGSCMATVVNWYFRYDFSGIIPYVVRWQVNFGDDDWWLKR